MTHKTCTKCSIEKELSHFAKNSRSKDGRDWECKECENIRRITKQRQKGILSRQEWKDLVARKKEENKLHSEQMKQKRHRKQILKRHEKKLEFINILGGKCIRCGLKPSKKWPVTCFEFHHINPLEKETHVANYINRGQWSKVLAEIDKCELYCANCHRAFHFNGDT